MIVPGGRARARRRAGLVLVASCLCGCYGSFGTVERLHAVHVQSTETRWTRTGLFIAFIVVPMYPVAAAFDLFIFHPVEFCTGIHPLRLAARTASPPLGQEQESR